MKIGTIIGVAATALTVAGYFGKKKITDITSLKDKIQFQIAAFRNVKFQNGKVVLDVDVTVINPTDIALDVPGNNLVLKTLHFFSKSGVKLGDANANTSDLALPAKSSRLVTNVPVMIDLNAVGNSFSEVLDIVSDPANMKIVADVEIFGQSFTINQ